MKKAGFILSIILATIFYSGSAQSQSKFQKVIGGTSGDEEARYGELTADGGQIIVGRTDGFGSGSNDVYLVKTDSTGAIEWNKTYGGVGSDIGYSVKSTSDGGYIVVGETSSSGAGNEDVFLIKTDASGDTLWTRTYGGSGTDICYSVNETFDGGYILAGYTGSFGTGAEDVYVIKTDALGDTLWTKTYGSGGFDYAYSIVQTADTGYVLTGETYAVGGGDVFLIKTNSVGDTTWTRTYGGAGFDGGWSVLQTMDGGYAFSGWTSSFGAGAFDIYLVKTDAMGDTLWTRTYGGTQDDVGLSLVETADTSYLVGGYTYSFGTINGDAYGLSVDATGTVLWSMAYGGVSGDAAYSIDMTSDGGYVLSGYSFSLSGGVGDFYLLRTDSSGSTGSCYETSTATVATTTTANVGTLNVTSVTNASVGAGTTVTTPLGVSKAEFFVTITVSTNNTCFGDSAGTATAVTTGGTLNYTYNWDDPSTQSTAGASNLPSGTYQVMVTDGQGCMDSATVTLTDPAPIVVFISDSNHIACNGDGDGSATVSASGGTGPLSYLWDDPSTQTDSAMTAVAGGAYINIVTDSVGCTQSTSFTVNEPSAISLSVSSLVMVVCNPDSSATMTATASGGIGSLTYLWDDPNTQTTAIATGVPNGNYMVVVTDSAGCSVTDSLTFGILASISSSSAPICGGICDGTANVVVIGNLGTVSYSWDDPSSQTTASASSLCSGSTFTATATDASGCSIDASVTFPSLSAMTITLNITNVNCFGNTNGAATVFVNGGSSPFTYWWPGLGIGSNFVNTLAVGNYDVIINDGNGCTMMQTASVTGPSAALSSSITTTSTKCFGSSDGKTDLTVSGGTSPYQYNWGGVTTEDLSAVSAGTYIVDITDDNGCTTSDTAIVPEAASLLVSGGSSSDDGDSTGQAWVTVSGGTGPYTYSWNDDLSQSTDTASGLAQGAYTIVVNDTKGCTMILEISVGDQSVGVFETTYEGAADDLARDMTLLSGGGHLIAGVTESFGAGGSDMFLLSTDEHGNFEWSKTYGGSADDGANAVLQTSDGGYIIAGYTSSFGSGNTDMYVVKTDVNGVIEWTQTYGGSQDEKAYSITETTSGYVIVGGTNSFGAGNTDVYAINIDDNGAILWTKTYGGFDYDYGYDIKTTSDGGYIIAGYTNSFGAGGSDAYLIKTDVTGTITWTKVAGGDEDDAAWSVIETTSGAYAFTGNTESFGSGLEDVYFVITDNFGNPVISKALGGSASDFGNELISTIDGGFAIAGYSKSFGNFGDGMYVIKTNEMGDVTWSRTYGGAFADRAWAIKETASGALVIAGNSQSFGLSVIAGFWEYYLVKTDDDGDSQCNIGSATTIDTDTSGVPLTVGGLEASGGTGVATSTIEMSALATLEILCYNTTDIQRLTTEVFELGVYPNPNNGQFTLSMNLISKGSSQLVRIYNVNGTLLRSEEISGSGKINATIDLGDVPAGMYYVQVISDGAFATKKVIIQ